MEDIELGRRPRITTMPQTIHVPHRVIPPFTRINSNLGYVMGRRNAVFYLPRSVEEEIFKSGCKYDGCVICLERFVEKEIIRVTGQLASISINVTKP
ncbi:hypothetical protein Ccrd_011081 [Cynara cardunculus var. scolymus]|uniref:Uncharacterized protein n=1 Tax=Cynara cardunculus var. scolymus TaxID=59895 RepID=A0A103YK34_CYNCS|nr:hypothetical protein Ccrd_011081 [Cynara cardunculus var. scolymus]